MFYWNTYSENKKLKNLITNHLMSAIKYCNNSIRILIMTLIKVIFEFPIIINQQMETTQSFPKEPAPEIPTEAES